MTNQPEIPSGSFVYYESFESVFQLLDDAEELTVRRALSALAFDGDFPELTPREMYAFKSIAPQIQANKVKRANGRKGGRPKGEKSDNDEEVSGNAPVPGKPLNPKSGGSASAETNGFYDEETTGYGNDKTNGFSEDKTTSESNVNVNVNANGNVNVNGSVTPLTPQGGNMADAADPETPVPSDPPKPKQRRRFVKPTAEEVAVYAAERGEPKFDAQHFIDYYESNGWRVGKNPMKDWKATIRTWLSRDRDNGSKGVTGVVPSSRSRPSDPYTDWTQDPDWERAMGGA